MAQRENKSIIGKIIRLILCILLILFIIGCYKVEFLANNKYIKTAREKIESTISSITNKASGGFAALVENYEPDDEDSTIYEIKDTQNRFYYNQLDEYSKIIYAEIMGNLDKIKNGEDNIKISSKLSGIADRGNINDVLMTTFQNAWDAFRNDNVDVFYLDGTKMCLVTKTIKRGGKTKYEFYISKGDNSNYFVEGFSSKEQVEKAEIYVNQKEQEILQSITGKNDYYKIMGAHNWIVENVQYNVHENSNNANIYGALERGAVVCEGYARLFKSLMDKMNIPCVLVSGVGINLEDNTKEDHAWNYVFLKGEWYAIDVTWDDPIIVGNGTVSADVKYRYFLKGSGDFEKSHKEDGQLVENGMKFAFPEIAKENYIKEEQQWHD